MTAKKTAAKKTAAPAASSKKTDPTKPTVVVQGGKEVPFDERANVEAKRAEREARARGETVETERYTVAEGHSVRKGSQRYMAGEAIDLTAADGDRMRAKGIVVKGEGKAAAKGAGSNPQPNIAKSTGTIGTDDSGTATGDEETEEAKAQREADEAAAAANDQQQTGDGLPSGAENR